MDKGGENGTWMLKEACEEEGIMITYTGTEAHQQNGEQERWFRSAFDCIRAHQIATKAPINLWADGMANCVYVYNRMVHGSHNRTPYELTFGKVPKVGTSGSSTVWCTSGPCLETGRTASSVLVR